MGTDLQDLWFCIVCLRCLQTCGDIIIYIQDLLFLESYVGDALYVSGCSGYLYTVWGVLGDVLYIHPSI